MAEMMDEHAPREADEPTDSDNQTDEQKKMVKRVEQLFEQSKKHKEKYDGKWIDYYRQFRGKQWTEKRPSYRHSEVINLIFQTIQSNVPMQTEARPRIEYIPQNPEDREFSEILNDVLESDWDKYDWSSNLLEVIYDANFYGSGFSCLKYNPDAEYGMGCIEYKSDDPFMLYPDPSARDINVESDYIIKAEPVPVEKLKIKYPDQREYIKADVLDYVQNSKTDLERVRWSSPADRTLHRPGESTHDTSDQNKVVVFEAYLKPHDVIEEKEEEVNSDTGEVNLSFVQKKKWPTGLKVTIANQRVLEEGPNPYDHSEYPYSKYDLYKLPREFWGIGEIEQLESPQRMFNKLFSFSLDVLTLMGNPIWVVDNTSGIEVRKLTSQPGLVVTKNQGTEARREEGVQLQPFVFDLIDRLTGYVDNISGSQEVSRGVRPEGITAAAAIEDLQDSAKTRIRQKMRNLDAYLRSVGRQYAYNVLQFYTAPRIFRLTNKEGSNKYFKMHIESKTDEKGRPIKVAQVRNYDESPNGQLMPGESREILIRGSFDVKVNTGSALPFNKQEKDQKMFKLFELGVIDPEELLKQIEYPNPEAVLERMRAMAAQQAAQEPQPA